MNRKFAWAAIGAAIGLGLVGFLVLVVVSVRGHVNVGSTITGINILLGAVVLSLVIGALFSPRSRNDFSTREVYLVYLGGFIGLAAGLMVMVILNASSSGGWILIPAGGIMGIFGLLTGIAMRNPRRLPEPKVESSTTGSTDEMPTVDPHAGHYH